MSLTIADLQHLASRFGTNPEPIGKPGGPGLWHHKGWQLPPGIQHVRNDLMQEHGMPESKATEMAIGIMANWAHGHDGHGNAVSPKVQAQAVATMTEFHALQAKNKATAKRATMTVTERAQLTASSINDLPDSDFAYIEPGGSKDSSGRTVPRSLRHFPIHDAAHIRNALARAPQSPFGDKAMPKITAAAKKAGIQVADDNAQASRSVASEIFRYYPLDDIRIVSRADGEPSGRIVEAYATVFDEPAEIHDQQGHYMETIDRSAFDATLERLRRSRGGFGSAVRVLFNHGKTMEGVPAPEFQRPIGKALDIRPDSRGLLTRTEYAKKPFAEEILDDIREGRITGQSFVGGIVRSDPELRGPGDRYRSRGGALTTVRRMALGLREYGPVLYGAYSGAEFLGVRMQSPGEPAAVDDFDDTDGEEFGPEMDGDDAGSTPEEVTSPRAHAHSLFAMRTKEAGIQPVRGIWQ